MASVAEFKPRLWVPGDWNAFFGFGTNILVNVLGLTGLLRFVLKMPDSLVFRRITPRAALLGSLAGISITFISMSPANQMFMTPVIGLICFAVILASWFGGVRYFNGMPGGLVAIAVGTVIAWASTALGFDYGGLSGSALLGSFSNFGFSIPIPAVDHVFFGFKFLGVILVTAIPFGIYDLVEAMDNVESASAAGDP